MGADAYVVKLAQFDHTIELSITENHSDLVHAQPIDSEVEWQQFPCFHGCGRTGTDG